MSGNSSKPCRYLIQITHTRLTVIVPKSEIAKELPRSVLAVVVFVIVTNASNLNWWALGFLCLFAIMIYKTVAPILSGLVYGRSYQFNKETKRLPRIIHFCAG